MSNVFHFEIQETWQRAETRRTWQFHCVYLTTANGVQQRVNTLRQEKGVPLFMSSMKHFRNFALSEVKKKFPIEIIASLVENVLCDHESTVSTNCRFCC